ncbi:hypothetical protein O1611_g9240 [Lasiodiplodia mahajangana]|uniref:Uncharacterized protein n=1 Tax=Lasiodiplodia mahajangana TaxID=1108764 RepID=A0ACC2JA56_9PEZI|nr:hypothetical protein O1611_g9240 [Lasiodiplodia mahajangana]
MDKKKKISFHLDTPYSAAAWPQILPKDQDTILELLCSLLSPLGHYRSQHIHPSKGNRAKKRKRAEKSISDTAPPAPPAPEIQSYVDIGLSCVSRCLQKTTSEGLRTSSLGNGQEIEEAPASRFYSAIFVARSGQPNALSSHLPQMVAVARICVGAPNSSALVDFTREHVTVASIPWLQEANDAEYRAARINAIETVIGVRKKAKGKSIK